MKRFMKYAGAALGALVLLVLGGFATMYAKAAEPERSIAIDQALVSDPGRPSIPVSIWYPTTAEPGFTILGTYPVRLASAGPVDGRKLPLVIVSHGNQGMASSHVDTAIALAEAGYVVVAPQHPGDSLRDTASVGGGTWFSDRARHVSRAADYVVSQWQGRGSVDPQRIGLFGFSAGGTTALMAIGGVLDADRIRSGCTDRREFACKLLKPDFLKAVPAVHDRRIKAAVVVAPGFGFGFRPDSLDRSNVPVQIWQGAADSNVPAATNGQAVSVMLPGRSELRLVPAATHFTFLAPCGLAAILLPKELCADPPGLDRKAFHDRFNRDVVKFFDRTLARRAAADAD